MIRLISFLALVWLPGFAAEPAESTDDALLRELLGDEEAIGTPNRETEAEVVRTEGPNADPAAVDPQAIERILVQMREAEGSLSAGRAGDARSAQLTTVSELQRLIDALEKQQRGSQSSSSSGSGAPQPQPEGTGTPQPATGGPGTSGSGTAGQPSQNREGKAEESSDRPRDRVAPAGTLRDFRIEIVRDAWGHLPPRLRDQLLNTGSDRNLPQYDALVRKYFESLAQPEKANPELRR